MFFYTVRHDAVTVLTELAPFTVPPDLEKILAAEPQIQQVSDDSRHYEA
jgi:hypothetical protein